MKEQSDVKMHGSDYGRFHRLTSSDTDPMRHVYFYKGSIFRYVEAEQIDTVRQFFESGAAEELIESGLMTPSILVEDTSHDSGLAVEQPELTAPSTLSEMPPSMRRDVSIALLHFARALDRYGYCLRDFDTSGFVIDRSGKPRFHNISAIKPKGSNGIDYAGFHASFIGPLRLINERPELAALVMRAGTISADDSVSIRRPLFRAAMRWISRRGSPGQRLFHLYRRLFVLSPFGGLLHHRMYILFFQVVLSELMNRSKGIGVQDDSWQIRLFSKIEKEISSMEFERVSQKWSDYHGDIQLSKAIDAGENWDSYYDVCREREIIRLLSESKGRTLLDVGANIGHFSILGSKLGYQTTAVDYDIGAIEKLYRIVRDAEKPASLRPFILDFVDLDAEQLRRFRSDAVLALGFVHHMRLVEFLPWAVITEKLSAMTGQILITEFKPGTGASSSNPSRASSESDDYHLENFTDALEKHFQTVEVVGDFTARNSTSPRTMLMCRR